jgi:hypothetical protein
MVTYPPTPENEMLQEPRSVSSNPSPPFLKWREALVGISSGLSRDFFEMRIMVVSPSKNKPVYRVNPPHLKGLRDLGNSRKISEERPFQSTASS